MNQFALATQTKIKKYAASELCKDLCGQKPFGSRHWEYPWAVEQSGLMSQKQKKVLDVAPDLTFPYASYLQKLGHSMTFIDLEKQQWADKVVWGLDPAQTGKEFLIMDVKNMTFDDGAFDCIFCISVLEHIVCPTQDPDHEKLGELFNPKGALPALSEMRRCLKINGRLILTVDVYGGPKWWPYFSRWNIFDDLEEIGFCLDTPSGFEIGEVFTSPDAFISEFHGPYITLGFCFTKERE